jgi:monoamine oxidase
LGAEFIHGQAPQTLALLREAALTAIALGTESWRCARDGSLQPDKDDFRAAARIFEGASRLSQDESIDEYLRRFGGDERSRQRVALARAFVEGFDAADPAIAGVRGIADEWRSGVDLTSSRPLGGYVRLFDFLRKTVVQAAALRLSTAVHRIAWKRGEVAVEATEGNGKQLSLRARTAIVTLPVGVLRGRDDGAPAFDPDLPSEKLDALQRIEMGHVVKVTLCFRTAFWERVDDARYRDAAFFRCDGGAFPAYWTQMPVRSELVVAWAGGPRAMALAGLSADALVERALDGFGTLANDSRTARNEFECGFIHDWTNDRFARGAYSYLAVGGDGARASLARPIDDTLFFAGEATSTDGQGGTVNGALETGERAAEEALNA